MSDQQLPTALGRGLRLLQNGQYWDAHEEWEDLWQSLPKNTAARRATQSLIQLAAICYKPEQAAEGRAQKDMQKGMQRLLATARVHLNASSKLPAPAPDWSRANLGEILDLMDEVHRDWVQGAKLVSVRRQIGEAAGRFSI